MTLDDFLCGAAKHFAFDRSNLSASDRSMLFEALCATRWPSRSALDSGNFDPEVESTRMINACGRLLNALMRIEESVCIVLIQQSVNAVRDAQREIEAACDDGPRARALVAKFVDGKPDSPESALEVDALVHELQQRARLLAHRLEVDGRCWADRDELLSKTKSGPGASPRLDRVVADFLRDLGPQGREYADRVLAAAAERWRAFESSVEGLARLQAEQQVWEGWGYTMAALDKIAIALWRDIVRPRFKAHSKAVVPALNLVVVRELSSTCWTDERRFHTREQHKHLSVGTGELVASVAALPANELVALEQSFPALGHLTAHRLIRWLVNEGHRRKMVPEPDASIILVEGGLRELARRIGSTTTKVASKSAPDELLVVLREGQRLRRQWPGGEAGGLWTFFLERAGPRKRSVVEIRLGAMLMPLYARPRLQKDQKILVPMVPLPPLVPRPRDHAAQAAYQMEVLMALIDRRQELVRDGGGYLSKSFLTTLAAGVGLPELTRQRAMSRWLEDGDDGQAFLELVGRDTYNLAKNDALKAARAFLLSTGERSIEQGERAGRVRGRGRKRSPDKPRTIPR